MPDGRPFFIAGLRSDAPDPAKGEIADSYTMVIGQANAAMRVHDRMLAILGKTLPGAGSSPDHCQPSCWCRTRPKRCRAGASATPPRVAGSRRIRAWPSRCHDLARDLTCNLRHVEPAVEETQ